MVGDRYQNQLTAQVVLKADSTTQPEEVLREFAQAGFTTGAFFANTFSITADAKKFEEYFGVKLLSTPQSGVEVMTEGESGSSNLPLTKLPATLSQQVEAVLFTTPPDFGPGSY